MKNYNLNLAWLYPELMSTYGDRGNIIVLQKIAESNNIDLEIIRINQTSDSNLLSSCNLLFMGGAQDLQQEIVMDDLRGKKGEIIKKLIEADTPGLFICGAYQFLGNYYKDSYGTEIKGLGIFDIHTESFKTKSRLIGNIVIKPNPVILSEAKNPTNYFVGFENHGGRTYLKNHEQAFAKVVVGFGNNEEDKTEGIHYKNSIGTYLHGPILSSNPELAISLLKLACKKKYGEDLTIEFDDELSKKAKKQMLKRLKISY